MREPEVSAYGVHRGAHRRRHQAALAEMANIKLDVGPLNTNKRVKAVGLAPPEPPTQLGGVEGVGFARVAGKV